MHYKLEESLMSMRYHYKRLSTAYLINCYYVIHLRVTKAFDVYYYSMHLKIQCPDQLHKVKGCLNRQVQRMPSTMQTRCGQIRTILASHWRVGQEALAVLASQSCTLLFPPTESLCRHHQESRIRKKEKASEVATVIIQPKESYRGLGWQLEREARIGGHTAPHLAMADSEVTVIAKRDTEGKNGGVEHEDVLIESIKRVMQQN